MKSEPRHFFVPPYVGPRGWLGRQSRQRPRLAARGRTRAPGVREGGAAGLGRFTRRDGQNQIPAGGLAADEVDPLKSRQAQAILKRLRQMYLSWPEVAEDAAVWLSSVACGEEDFRVVARDGTRADQGARQQGARSCAIAAVFLGWCCGSGADDYLMSASEIPAYMGHQGWIALDVTEHCDWQGGARAGSWQAIVTSRCNVMLKALDGQARSQTVCSYTRVSDGSDGRMFVWGCSLSHRGGTLGHACVLVSSVPVHCRGQRHGEQLFPQQCDYDRRPTG